MFYHIRLKSTMTLESDMDKNAITVIFSTTIRSKLEILSCRIMINNKVIYKVLGANPEACL